MSLSGPSSLPGSRLPPRSAEQTSRLLLSSAFRYDTIETLENKRRIRSGEEAILTVKLNLMNLECLLSTSEKNENEEAREEGANPSEEEAAGGSTKKKAEKRKKSSKEASKRALHSIDCASRLKETVVEAKLAIFDTVEKLYVGAAYRLSLDKLNSEPLVFQATAKQCLVIELICKPSSAEPNVSRVAAWGFCSIAQLANTKSLPLYAGSGDLMLIEPKRWPLEASPSTGKPIYQLHMTSDASLDVALERLMTELVPPGLIVPFTFATDTPNPTAKAFQVVLESIHLQASPKATEAQLQELMDPGVKWSIAVVAHNGYQQLSTGDEVPLLLKTKTDEKQEKAENPSTQPHELVDFEATNRLPTLEAEFPLKISQLPVHASTSLVLAIRRRRIGESAQQQSLDVLGFGVFPLCLMPMKDRDLRVENLPALQGPFSCEDARLLMAESSSPYGRALYSLTLSLAFHNTPTPGERTAEGDEALAQRLQVLPDASSGSDEDKSKRRRKKRSGRAPKEEEEDREQEKSSEEKKARKNHRSHRHKQPQEEEVGGILPSHTESRKGGTLRHAGSSDEVFGFLGRIMEELYRVRVVQDDLLRLATSSVAKNVSPALRERVNGKLEDVADIIDLRPQLVGIPWQVRHQIVEGVQPLLHPVKGTPLDDFSRAEHSHTRSIFGFRLEGLSLDSAFEMPEDLCFLFSFGPMSLQKVGPVSTSRVLFEATSSGIAEDSDKPGEEAKEVTSCKSYRFVDKSNRGGITWFEPVNPSEFHLSATSMDAFKYNPNQELGKLYLHVYDALTMFYICTATIPLSQFHRPYTAEAAVIPMDIGVTRDLTLTEQPVPESVFPVVMHAGQLHLTLACVGVTPELPPGKQESGGMLSEARTTAGHRVVGPQNGSRLIVAKKLPHVLPPSERLISPTGDPPAPVSSSEGLAEPSSDKINVQTELKTNDLHWKRAEYFKKALEARREAGDEALNALPGVPSEHIRDATTAQSSLEHQLRLVDRDRNASKSKAIAKALKERLTERHEVELYSWRPHTIYSVFENLYNTAVEFALETPTVSSDSLVELTSTVSVVLLGPREKTSLPIVVRLKELYSPEGPTSPLQLPPLSVKVYAQPQRHIARVIEVVSTILPPHVDRRFEIFGAPGATVAKKFYVRQYSSTSLPPKGSQDELLKRLNFLCATVTCSSSETTSARTLAKLDPITQNYLTAWEEVEVVTTVPPNHGQQRVEYITLFKDGDRSKVLEVWELCVFPCYAITTREIPWGQTTTIALPVEENEEVYCSNQRVRVEQTASSFLLHIRPSGVGVDRMLLHSLRNEILVKTLLTVPVIHPTPTATQVIELSLDDVKNGSPVLRRITFTHGGDREETFSIHHNYRYQLAVSPSRFSVAPQDIQHIHLRLSMLELPPGQLEGRWPMWIFINDSHDKTVESYHLQVVLRLHPVAMVSEKV